MKPVLYTEDKEEIKAGRDAKMTMKVASMSCYLGTSQKQSDEETYKNYFVDYGDQYFCVLCYNMQLSTSNIPNILCPMELRTAPVSKKNSGNISNFKTHMTTQHPLFLLTEILTMTYVSIYLRGVDFFTIVEDLLDGWIC